ncbi:cytochrome c [Bradyrhizobium cosmicum]|uniref:cytochrome c n=1 Tax=Bradyrhizobium cosmicum TaxID=1404864 RepID=UPI001165A707|nr:cytochrome c [Bradyrhizobium cosmicum]QDP26184.1 cytochrome c [Bradyrhizobium cosmicum]
MSQAFGSLATACFLLGIVMPSFAADAVNGKDIATRWCASCHVVERGQTSATDQAPPFASIGKAPEFDQNKLAFLLLMPHPNMPSLSLNRAEIADLADYIRSLR